MSDRLTDAELDRLEGLHAAAMPGPWRSDVWDDVTAAIDGLTEVVADAADSEHADLIASAHNALPALLAEVREHRAREARYAAALDALVDGDGR